MIINFVPGADEKDISKVYRIVEELGYSVKRIGGVEREVGGVVGEIENGDRDAIKELTRYGCIEAVVDISQPHKLLRLNASPEIKVKDDIVLDKHHLEVVGGPCTVEGEEMIKECAEKVASSGCRIIRGGAFKPRTDPETFRGYGEDALKWLAEAAAEHNLAINTEVLDARDVEVVANYAHILQIGTRNMYAHALIEEAAATGLPVLVKRGFQATIDEFLMAAKAVVLQDNPNVIMCERGIRTFEPHHRFVMDLNTIAFLKEKYPNVVLCADSSHGTGDSQYVKPLALAAVMAGADSLLIEAHPDPEKARIDGRQSLAYRGKDSLACLVANVKMGYALRKGLENGTQRTPEELCRFLAPNKTFI